MEETTDNQNSHQNHETYEESYNSLNAELATVSHDTLTMAVASITDTEPQQEQQECQNTNTMNVTIQEQYNSTTQTTNNVETKGETTKPDANLKQILDFMKILSEKVDKIENQNLNQQNNNGNPMNTPAIPSTLMQTPIETITIKEETISDNEIDPPSQTCDGNGKKRKGTQCPLCNKAVQNELMLKKHLKAEHKMQEKQTKPKEKEPETVKSKPKIIEPLPESDIESEMEVETEVTATEYSATEDDVESLAEHEISITPRPSLTGPLIKPTKSIAKDKVPLIKHAQEFKKVLAASQSNARSNYAIF